MVNYLPISISNRTTATIHVHYEASSSSSSGHIDSIGSFQTTPTKAIKTDFKLQKLQSVISIHLEEPESIKIQLIKKTRKVHRLHHHSSSVSNDTIATNHNQAPSKKRAMIPEKPATIKNKITKALHSQTHQNQKFFRLQVDYYLNSQLLKIRDQEVIEEQAEEQDGRTIDAISGQRGAQQSTEELDDTTLDPTQDHGNTTDHGSGYVQARPKKLFIPKFEIFQSISDDGSVSIMVLKSRNFSNWMSHLPDEVSISELTIPGSHQSCSTYGWPIGQCQSRSLARQLNDGIRFLDIRLALPIKTSSSKKQKPESKTETTGKLVAYHGIQSQVIKFQQILKILDDFLNSEPTETIIISIKRENHTDSELFKEALRREFIEFYQSEENFKSHWWLNSFLPNSLKQVRGKLILFSRKLFMSDDEEDFGIRFPVWPNNSSEIWETSIPNANVAVQDWYNIGSCLSIPKKSLLACVSLCGALHGPLRTTPSPIPLTRSTNQDRSTSSHRSLNQDPPVNPNTSASSNPTAEASKVGEEGERSLTRCTFQETQVIETHPRTWVITFLSASSLLLGFPTICSKGIGLPKLGLGIEGINSRVARWLVSRRDHYHHPSPNVNATSSTNIKGVVCMMDFYQSPKGALVSLLVDCNFTSQEDTDF
ncbi:hypothetical protein PCANC_22627 [Puccinia coronata f. sp. avenae]|uniref:Phosphatidylinositol-specific phospholipase C X domain-containing protein n=1 Tax=Puccinia coronata f. sp. avenae TaxID=200324 RepID=A0A2N5TPV9_9BASI|nr:hypothetical protein PCANC_22627 [Puccinia coronata f. sp. avenae]PLW27539.1 hypothetical protein PCASD_16264 [Puccinia coronata f. sp. avenae]